MAWYYVVSKSLSIYPKKMVNSGGTCFDKYEKHETCLSMSIFLNLSHSPTFVMQNGDSGTSSPVKWTPDQWLKKNMLKAVFIFLYKKNVQVQDK